MNEAEAAPGNEFEIARIQQFQREQLSRLHALPMGEVIPLDIQKRLSGGLILSYEPDKGQGFTHIYQAPNGIAMIVCGEVGNPTFQPVAKVNNLYYVDRKTGNAVDLSVLWGQDAYPGDHMSVWYDRELKRNRYDPGSKSVLVTGFDSSIKEMGLRAHHTLFHELGHQSQDRFGFVSTDTEEAALISSLLERIHALPDALFMRNGFKFLVGKIYPRESQQFKNKTVFLERNAHAFAVALIRRLHNEGIDLTRGFPDGYIKPYIEKTLESYDWKFDHLPGGNFSLERRKQQRTKGSTVRNILKRLAGR